MTHRILSAARVSRATLLAVVFVGLLGPTTSLGAAAPAAVLLRHTFNGGTANDWFGSTVGGSGDVNGDGFADVIIGASRNDAGGSEAGSVYVFFGGPSSDATPDFTITGTIPFTQFGNWVSSAGDMNGDGYTDVLVGHALFSGNTGRALVYLGGPTPDAVADLTLSNGEFGSQFGGSAAEIGDVNGDGFSDIIVGSYFSGGTGRAYVYFGGSTLDGTADLVLNGAASGDQFAFASSAGDVNGDGYADFLVTAYRNDAGGLDAGRVYVYFGGPTVDATADWILTGAVANNFFGSGAAAAGDVNGDGYGDVIVGANDANITAGHAYLFYGGATPDAIVDQTYSGEAATDLFGNTVAGLDINQDGYSDVAVGAFQNDAGGGDAGRVYVYLGGPTTTGHPYGDAIADFLFNGGPGDELGVVLANAGDFRGDGFPDLIAGAFLSDSPGLNSGSARLYDFNRYHLLTPNSAETYPVGSTQVVKWLGAAPADVWLSADGGATQMLLASAVGGSASNALPIRVPHTPSKFARIRITPATAYPWVKGSDQSDSLFTVQSSITLLTMSILPLGDGAGAQLSWATEPSVGPEGIAGYRLSRIDASGEHALGGLIEETSFVDSDARDGAEYRLMAVNGLGEETPVALVTFSLHATMAASPSPLMGEGGVRVHYTLPAESRARVDVIDAAGRVVETLVDGVESFGPHDVRWEAHNARRGVYAIRLFDGTRTQSQKVLVLR